MIYSTPDGLDLIEECDTSLLTRFERAIRAQRAAIEAVGAVRGRARRVLVDGRLRTEADVTRYANGVGGHGSRGWWRWRGLR